jgi:hypothetical protein
VAIEVAEAAADHEQRRDRERVPGDDPLDAGEVRLELAQDRRDRDVQDRVVENRNRD